MSVFSKGTKKKVNKEPVKKVKVKITKNPDTKNISGEQAEALQNGEIPPGAIMNPMVIPDFFNNIRNNYYVANKIMWITGFIEWGLITEVMRRLNFYDDGTKDPITLYVASPGGECDAGWALVDMIEKLKHKGITVKTICAGSCSSMAAVILAAGSKGERYAFPSSRIMIHQAGIELTGGKLDDIANTTKELQYWTDLTAKYISKVSGKKVKEVEKELCYDNYMTPSEAKKFGIIDKIDVVLA